MQLYDDRGLVINEDYVKTLANKLAFKWNNNAVNEQGVYAPDGNTMLESFRVDGNLSSFDFSNLAKEGDSLYLATFYSAPNSAPNYDTPTTLLEVVDSNGVVKQVSYIQNISASDITNEKIVPTLNINNGFLYKPLGLDKPLASGDVFDANVYDNYLTPAFSSSEYNYINQGQTYFALNNGQFSTVDITDPLRFKINLENFNQSGNTLSLKQVFDSAGKPSLILQVQGADGSVVKNILLQSNLASGVNINDLMQNQFVFNNGTLVNFSQNFSTKPFAQTIQDPQRFYVDGNFYEQAAFAKNTYWISDYNQLEATNNVYQMPTNWPDNQSPDGTRDSIKRAVELDGFNENSVISFPSDNPADFSKMSIAVFKQPSTITLIQIKDVNGTLIKNLKISNFDGTKLTSDNFKGVVGNFKNIQPGIAVGPQTNITFSILIGIAVFVAIMGAYAIITSIVNKVKKQRVMASVQEELKDCTENYTDKERGLKEIVKNANHILEIQDRFMKFINIFRNYKQIVDQVIAESTAYQLVADELGEDASELPEEEQGEVKKQTKKNLI